MHDIYSNYMHWWFYYSGDQDIRISYVGTLDWIKMLNISITEEWKPWFVYNQVGG